jgi:hypothetical protein
MEDLYATESLDDLFIGSPEYVHQNEELWTVLRLAITCTALVDDISSTNNFDPTSESMVKLKKYFGLLFSDFSIINDEINITDANYLDAKENWGFKKIFDNLVGHVRVNRDLEKNSFLNFENLMRLMRKYEAFSRDIAFIFYSNPTISGSQKNMKDVNAMLDLSGIYNSNEKLIHDKYFGEYQYYFTGDTRTTIRHLKKLIGNFNHMVKCFRDGISESNWNSFENKFNETIAIKSPESQLAISDWTLVQDCFWPYADSLKPLLFDNNWSQEINIIIKSYLFLVELNGSNQDEFHSSCANDEYVDAQLFSPILKRMRLKNAAPSEEKPTSATASVDTTSEQLQELNLEDVSSESKTSPPPARMSSEEETFLDELRGPYEPVLSRSQKRAMRSVSSGEEGNKKPVASIFQEPKIIKTRPPPVPTSISTSQPPRVSNLDLKHRPLPSLEEAWPSLPSSKPKLTASKKDDMRELVETLTKSLDECHAEKIRLTQSFVRERSLKHETERSLEKCQEQLDDRIDAEKELKEIKEKWDILEKSINSKNEQISNLESELAAAPSPELQRELDESKKMSIFFKKQLDSISNSYLVHFTNKEKTETALSIAMTGLERSTAALNHAKSSSLESSKIIEAQELQIRNMRDLIRRLNAIIFNNQFVQKSSSLNRFR